MCSFSVVIVFANGFQRMVPLIVDTEILLQCLGLVLKAEVGKLENTIIYVPLIFFPTLVILGSQIITGHYHLSWFLNTGYMFSYKYPVLIVSHLCSTGDRAKSSGVLQKHN